MNPKISVIIPVYNGEKYLKECMDSILTQTFDDIEILCVNDGSTDHTAEILSEYQKRDPRIRVINQKNAGYGVAMNHGVKEATGIYIAVAESDDYMDRQMLQILYETAEEHRAEVVKADFYSFVGEGAERKLRYMQTPPHRAMYGKVLDSTVTTAVFYAAQMTWEGIYRRDFLLTHEIWHNESPGASYQDNGFWFQVFTWAKRVYFVRKALYYYRGDNEDSSTQQKDFGKLSQMFGEYDFIRCFLDRHPQEKERLYHTYVHFRMNNFVGRFYCAEESAKEPIVRRIHSELKELIAEPGFSWELYGTKLQHDLKMILEDPKEFIQNPGENMNEMGWEEMVRRSQRENDVNPDITMSASVIMDYVESLSE